MSLVPNRTSLPSRCYCPIPQAHRTILYFYFGSRSPLSPASTDVERLQIYLYKKRLWVCSGIHQRDEWSFSFLSFCAASSYFPQEIYILNALHRHMEALVLGLGLDPFFFCVSSPPIRFSIPFVFVLFIFFLFRSHSSLFFLDYFFLYFCDGTPAFFSFFSFIKPPAVYWTRELTETNHVRLLRQPEESRNVMKNFFFLLFFQKYFILCVYFLFFIPWDGVIGR